MKLNSKSPFLLALCLLLLPLRAAGQQYDDSRIYMENAKEQAELFRGMTAPEYRFQFNGTCYAGGKEFQKGEIMYNGRLYTDVDLNLDACQQLVVVKANLITATVPAYVEYAVIGGTRYVNLKFGDKIEGAPEGFCREVYDNGDIAFYTLVQKTIRMDDGYHNGDDIGYDDPEYKDYVTIAGKQVRVETYFSYSARYFVVKDGVATQVKTRGAFLKFFDKADVKAMKKYASKNTRPDMELDEYGKILLQYKEGLK